MLRYRQIHRLISSSSKWLDVFWQALKVKPLFAKKIDIKNIFPLDTLSENETQGEKYDATASATISKMFHILLITRVALNVKLFLSHVGSNELKLLKKHRSWRMKYGWSMYSSSCPGGRDRSCLCGFLPFQKRKWDFRTFFCFSNAI